MSSDMDTASSFLNNIIDKRTHKYIGAELCRLQMEVGSPGNPLGSIGIWVLLMKPFVVVIMNCINEPLRNEDGHCNNITEAALYQFLAAFNIFLLFEFTDVN